ncbi:MULTISPECIES: hypothetical protein [unclassified Paraburkholderia]|uniref:hypothetical protein n=1 Tax=unclassified Paraburkholderia TaxID=2615204 RepID=UPI00160B917F|nr:MULTISPECIES: hypothetical protein [unclassified Paraburkholderia]MBB5442947.1 hypothetical protein [Paraburkholderia sp. WSM4177]MBB5483448.1 hypothetical protein [Paraburkholderia sp. WSM4180]
MSDASPSNSDISSPHNRIAILEDLLAFHCERNMHGVGAIFEMVAWLECSQRADLCAEELRARIEYARVGLTRLAHELAIGNLDTGATRVAMLRSSLVSSHPERLS